MATVKKAVVKAKVEDKEEVAAVEPQLDSAKQDIIKLLLEMGVTADKSKSYSDLVAMLRTHMKSLEDKAVDKQVDSIERIVAQMKSQTNLQDEGFLRRLAIMGVPPIYVWPYKKRGDDFESYLFVDQDNGRLATDEQIWAKIRHSGIRTVPREAMFVQRLRA